MISADKRGVTAMMHVAIKKTRMRLIAFGPAKDGFIGESSGSLLSDGRLKSSRRLRVPTKINDLPQNSQIDTDFLGWRARDYRVWANTICVNLRKLRMCNPKCRIKGRPRRPNRSGCSPG